jgi:hypothetical protein
MLAVFYPVVSIPTNLKLLGEIIAQNPPFGTLLLKFHLFAW